MSADLSQTFDKLQAKLGEGGVGSLLDELVEQMRAQGQYHDLYQALEMRLRQTMELPLDAAHDETLSDSVRDAYDAGRIEACKEVGLLLLEEAKLEEGWFYLRATGDRELAAKALEKIDVDEENTEAMIGVLLHEGVDPARGFGLVLEHYGSCNAITTFEQTFRNVSVPDQQAMASKLLRHLNAELFANLKADIENQEGGKVSAETLKELLKDRDWLFTQGGYHVDTTHLASVVRFARILTDKGDLQIALDLTAYGSQLDAQFQYAGDEPFADNYAAHALYFNALLGEQQDEAVAYFHEKANTVDQNVYGMIAVEEYINLLARLDRTDEALAASLEMFGDNDERLGVAPSPLELACAAGDVERYLEYCREHNQLLSFAAALARTNS